MNPFAKAALGVIGTTFDVRPFLTSPIACSKYQIPQLLKEQQNTTAWSRIWSTRLVGSFHSLHRHSNKSCPMTPSYWKRPLGGCLRSFWIQPSSRVAMFTTVPWVRPLYSQCLYINGYVERTVNSMISLQDRTNITDLARDLDKLAEDFDRAVGVEALRTAKRAGKWRV